MRGPSKAVLGGIKLDLTGKTDEDKKIWYTYHKQALMATRKAVKHDKKLNSQVRDSRTDKSLSMRDKSYDDDEFTDSLVAIVLNVFVAEYRINRVGEKRGIWSRCFKNYIDENGGTVKRGKKFSDLSLYQKWRNLPKFLNEKETDEYTKLTKNLKEFIHIRNKIAHAEYDKIKGKISPQNALACYNTVSKAMIELNVILGRHDEEKAKEILEELLL